MSAQRNDLLGLSTVAFEEARNLMLAVERASREPKVINTLLATRMQDEAASILTAIASAHEDIGGSFFSKLEALRLLAEARTASNRLRQVLDRAGKRGVLKQSVIDEVGGRDEAVAALLMALGVALRGATR